MDIDKLIRNTREVTLKGLSDAAQGAAVVAVIVGLASVVISVNRVRAGKSIYKPKENAGEA